MNSVKVDLLETFIFVFASPLAEMIDRIKQHCFTQSQLV